MTSGSFGAGWQRHVDAAVRETCDDLIVKDIAVRKWWHQQRGCNGLVNVEEIDNCIKPTHHRLCALMMKIIGVASVLVSVVVFEQFTHILHATIFYKGIRFDFLLPCFLGGKNMMASTPTMRENDRGEEDSTPGEFCGWTERLCGGGAI